MLPGQLAGDWFRVSSQGKNTHTFTYTGLLVWHQRKSSPSSSLVRIIMWGISLYPTESINFFQFNKMSLKLFCLLPISEELLKYIKVVNTSVKKIALMNHVNP